MINPHEAMQAIDRLREQLMAQKEATMLFGNPKELVPLCLFGFYNETNII